MADLLPRLAAAALRIPGQAVRYLGAVMGADAYDRYRANLLARHPDAVPMTERAFWREHMDWQDEHPQGRCC